MHEEDAFIQTIIADPKDDTARLVYADWLEERGDPVASAKAEFLRVTVETAGLPRRKRKRGRRRLQQLAADLDPPWLAAVSHLDIENCQGKRVGHHSRRSIPIRFDFRCDRGWHQLQSTADPTVRFCDSCRQHVHYCDTITKAREHADEDHCVAVDIGVIRREGDLHPGMMMMLGRMTPNQFLREEERLRPDAVSLAREQRERELRQSQTNV
jgi:uncharacterized protein (TIGR02996 family)